METSLIQLLLLAVSVCDTVRTGNAEGLSGLCLQSDSSCTELAEGEGCTDRASQQNERVNTEICTSHNFQANLSNSQCSTGLDSQSRLSSLLCDKPSCEAPENGFLLLNYTLMHKGDGKFNVGIRWELLSGVNVSGYTLIVSLGSPWSCAAESYVMCDVTDLPSYQNGFVYSHDYHLQRGRNEHLYIKLIPKGWCDGSQVTLEVPESCHGLCPGACSVCEYELTKNSKDYDLAPPEDVSVSLCRSPDTDLFVASVSWRPGRYYSNPYPNQTYYIAVYKSDFFELFSRMVEVVGKTSVELHNLSLVSGQEYYFKVFPYDCTCGRRSGYNRTAISDSIPMCSSQTAVPTSFPKPSTTLTHQPSTTLTHQPSTTLTHRPSTTLTHRPSTLTHQPSTTLTHQTFTTLTHPPSSTLPNSTTLTPPRPLNDSPFTHHWLWSIPIVILAAIFALFILVTIALCHLRGQSPHAPLKKNHSISLFLPQRTIDILLVYSLRTPTTEVEYILENFVQPLRQYDVRVLFYDTLYGGIGIPQWMETSVAKSSKVFLVCNSQFKKEWEDSSVSLIEGNLVHLLKQNFFAHVRTSSDYMAKYALLFTKADQKAESCIASSYLQNLQKFFVDSEDPTKLDHVARFIRNCKTYSLSMGD